MGKATGKVDMVQLKGDNMKRPISLNKLWDFSEF